MRGWRNEGNTFTWKYMDQTKNNTWHKQVCVYHLSVLLAVVCGRAVLWRGSAVAVGLCRLIVLVPLLHGLLRHTHTLPSMNSAFLSLRDCFVVFFLCHLLIFFMRLIKYCSCSPAFRSSVFVFPDKLNRPFYWLSNHDSFVWMSRV